MTKGPIIDTLILHHLAEPDLQRHHDLGFACHDLLVVDAWKEEFRETEDEVFGRAQSRKDVIEAANREELRIDALKAALAARRALRGAIPINKEALKALKKTFRESRTAWKSAKKRLCRSRAALLAIDDMEDSLLEYNGRDAQATANLANSLFPRTNGAMARVREVEHQLLPLAITMFEKGMPVDEGARVILAKELTETMASSLETLSRLSEIKWGDGGNEKNPKSPGDRKWLLYDFLSLPVRVRTEKKGEPATGSDAMLPHLSDPTVKALFDYDSAHKLFSTFVEKLEVDSNGRVHYSWMVGAQVTGRWSSSPSAQNIHPKVRKIFVAPQGYVLVGADFAQLEARIIAALSQCGAMINAFKRCEDIHSVNAAAIFGEAFSNETNKERRKALRDLGKMVVHASDYGAGAPTITNNILTDPEVDPIIRGLVTEVRVREILREFERKFPEVPKWRLAQERQARNDGWLSTEPLGRTRVFPRPKDIESTVCFNWPIQSAASDIMNLSLLKIVERIQPDEEILGNFHDATMVLTREGRAETVKTILEESMRGEFFGVPLAAEAKIAKSWSEVF